MLFRLYAILLSLILVMLGSSMLTTLIPIYLNVGKFSTNIISLIAAANFIGLIIGAVYSKNTITSLGYKKTFIIFIIALSLSSAAQGLLVNIWLWLFIRFINGYLLAGIYIIVESWLLTLSSPHNRNRILASYLTTFYAATALGQFSLQLFESIKIFTIIPFILSSGLMMSAILPLMIIKQPKAALNNTQFLSITNVYKSSPLGMCGCLAAGMILGIFYSFGPLFLGEGNIIHLLKQANLAKTANFMGFTILGGTLGQFPIGWLADRFNRRFILMLITFITSICALLLLLNNAYPPEILNLFAFGFGACAFSLYQLSMSQAMQTLPTHQIVAATSSLILIYSIGSALGPIVANLAIRLAGNHGIFGSITLIGLTLGIYSIKKINTEEKLRKVARSL